MIFNILNIQNPWWQDADWCVKGVRRVIFDSVEKDLETNNITVIKGSRQSGKTFLIKQLITHLLQNNENPRDIFYLSFDDPRLRDIVEKNNLLNLIEEMRQERKGKWYLFIDEFQKADVSDSIKVIAEGNIGCKVIISGSSSLAISEKVSESLLGRTRTFCLFPFSFMEFLTANNISSQRLTSLTDLLNKFLLSPDKAGYGALESFYIKNSLLFLEIKRLFNRYLLVGGYPKITSNLSINDSFIIIQEILNAYLEKDILSEMKINKIKEYRLLMEYFASDRTGIINIANLSRDLKINQITVKKFLNILEYTYLIKTLSVFTTNRISSLKKSEKVIFYDTGLRNYLAQTMDNDIMEKEKGQLLDNFVFSSLEKFNQYYFSGMLKIFYWRNADKNEVDFILSYKGKIVPVEVKSSSNLNRGYRVFVDKMGLNQALTITIDEFKLIEEGGKSFFFIPALLLAGI